MLVAVKEVLFRVVVAESVEEVEEKYNNEEIVLDFSDLAEHKIYEVKG